MNNCRLLFSVEKDTVCNLKEGRILGALLLLRMGLCVFNALFFMKSLQKSICGIWLVYISDYMKKP